MSQKKYSHKTILYSALFCFAMSNVSNASVRIVRHEAQNRIPNHYIVILRNGLTKEGIQSVINRNFAPANVDFQYSHVFNGFSALLSPEDLNKIMNDPDVAFIEEDAKVSTNFKSTPVSVNEVQDNPPSWGLTRIDHPNLPLGKSYTYSSTGKGVNVYVVDTGIRTTHTDFEGRAFPGFTSISDGKETSDCNGHGTHVSGTIGGKSYGVAKNVNLFAVRVLDCNGSGSIAGVIAGLDWVHANYKSPAVISMSLGGGASDALDAAVDGNIQAGITAVVAAGNNNGNACFTSPARAPRAITAGASNNDDSRASYSNFGSCVTLFAPGTDITSGWNGSDSDAKTISGTSMATPHISGVVALYLQDNPNAKPDQVKKVIVSSAVANQVKDPKGTVNLLLQSSFKKMDEMK